jgi:uncharacterized Tic20 family protein
LFFVDNLCIIYLDNADDSNNTAPSTSDTAPLIYSRIKVCFNYQTKRIFVELLSGRDPSPPVEEGSSPLTAGIRNPAHPGSPAHSPPQNRPPRNNQGAITAYNYEEVSMDTSVAGEERLLAAIAHASVVASGLGILIGVLIWLTQREKSAFAARQGLQAAVYQLLGLIAIVAIWFLWGIFYALTFIPLIRAPHLYPDAPPPIFWVGMGSMVIPLIVMAIWGLYGLWGALQSWRGRDFKYLVVGNLLPKDLSP